MKTAVRVSLKAECEVEIVVEHQPDEDPAHLTPEEQRKALSKAESFPTWEIDKAKVIG